jgi:uncharacterized membrane protein YdjX (TVP38/TMEM64 family)
MAASFCLMRRPERQWDEMKGTPEIAAPRRGSTPLRIFLVVLFATGLGAFLYLDLGRFLSLDALQVHREELLALVGRLGIAAWGGYILVYAVSTAFSLPGGALLTILGGFLFGPWIGVPLTLVGATAGATGLFLAARYVFHDALRARAGAAMRRMEDGFNENALNYLLFLRLVPAFPFWLVNLVPAFLGVKLGTYVLATFIGIVPGTIVYSLVGDGLGAVLEAGGELSLGIIFEPRFLAPILGLAVLALLPVLYKSVRRRPR